MSGIFQLQAKDSLVRINHYDVLNAIQNFNWDSAMNAENLTQLGDENYDAQMTQPSVSVNFESRATGSTASFLKRMIYTLDGGGEFTGYGGVGNTGIIQERDLERAVCDLTELQKANEVFDRATFIPRCHLSQFSMSASTEGAATESYAFEADILGIYRKPEHDLLPIPVTRKTGAETTTVLVPADYDVEGTVVDAAAEWKIKYLDINGTQIDPSKFTVTAGGVAEDEIVLTAAAIAEGIEFPKGEKLTVVCYKKTPGTWPTIVYPTTARFVKADQIDLFLFDPDDTFDVGGNVRTLAGHITAGIDLNTIPFGTANVLLRVQSFSMAVDVQREPLREIRKNSRGTTVYYRAATFPLNVSSNFEVLTTDLNEFAKLQGANLYGEANPDTLTLAAFENKTWVLAARYYKQGAALQTAILRNGRVEQTGHGIASGGRSTQSYSLTGSSFALQGTNI